MSVPSSRAHVIATVVGACTDSRQPDGAPGMPPPGHLSNGDLSHSAAGHGSEALHPDTSTRTSDAASSLNDAGADAPVTKGDAAPSWVDVAQVPARGSEAEVQALLPTLEGPCTSSMPLYPYTVHVDASGLGQAEGASATIYTKMALAFGTSCAARATTVVEGGSLALDATSLSDGAAYPTVAIWIDVDQDGLCELDEDLVYRELWTVGQHASRSFSAADLLDSAERAQGCDPFGGDRSDGTCVFVDPTEVPFSGRADMHASGSGFDQLDGHTIRVVTVTREVSPLAIAQSKIEAGAFELRIPRGLVDYTGVGVYVDLDDDDRCDTDEPMYEMTTGPATADTVLALRRDQLAPGDCLINGGVGDLTVAASCGRAAN